MRWCALALLGVVSLPRIVAAHFPAMVPTPALEIVTPALQVAEQAGGQDTTKHGKKAKPPAGTKTKKDPVMRLVEPWPDTTTLRERHDESEKRPLFRSSEPVAFTLIANFKEVNRDRDTLSARRYPATLVIARDDGAIDSIPVKLRTRGHWRLMSRNCAFVPLRLEFPKKETKGTLFAGERALKLGTHCQADHEFEQYTLREYLAYRAYNLFTPFSFRARLAKATYVDSATGRTLDARTAMFVESEDALARRMEGRLAAVRGALFEDVDAETLLRMSLFEYLLGNTDWSLYSLHNVRLVQNSTGVMFPVPYDFDFSGLVHARYAIPDPKLNIRTVRERLFRGPCRSVAELEPVLATIRARKNEILALYDSLPDLDRGYRDDARDYLNDFFTTISRPGSTKNELIDSCIRKGGV